VCCVLYVVYSVLCVVYCVFVHVVCSCLVVHVCCSCFVVRVGCSWWFVPVVSVSWFVHVLWSWLCLMGFFCSLVCSILCFVVMLCVSGFLSSLFGMHAIWLFFPFDVFFPSALVSSLCSCYLLACTPTSFSCAHVAYLCSCIFHRLVSYSLLAQTVVSSSFDPSFFRSTFAPSHVYSYTSLGQ